MGLGDDLLDAAGRAIGELENIGLRYPVKPYIAKVSDALWRGSRIEDSGAYAALVRQGFKGVVNLCEEQDWDSKGAEAAGLNHLHIPITDNTAPTPHQVRAFLAFACVTWNQACYVHCEAGKGRTGVMVACYRISAMGWTPEAALKEAQLYGLAMPCQEDFILAWGRTSP